MVTRKSDSIDWRSVLAGMLVATLTALLGFMLVRNQRGDMGFSLFFLLPVAAGLAAGLITRSGSLLPFTLLFTFLTCTTLLLILKVEGWVCIVMSAPIIFAGLGIGAFIGHLFRKHVIDKLRAPKTARLIALIILPILLSGANSVERASNDFSRTEIITSSVVLDATPDQVWDAIKRVDRIDLPRPFLLRIGLPVPVSCDLDVEAVGGERTCHFDSGYIKERVVEWNRPFSMKMNVTEVQVPGRDWLSFQDASYEFREQMGQTLLIRKTTIVSRLLPAWYWRPLERIGVETEHNYLFEYLRLATARRATQ